jgi:hypothetical protein
LIYTIEDFRGALTWKTLLKSYPEFSYAKREPSSPGEFSQHAWESHDLPVELSPYLDTEVFVDFTSNRTVNFVFSGYTSVRALEFPLSPYRRCSRGQPSSLLKNGTKVSESEAAVIILGDSDFLENFDWKTDPAQWNDYQVFQFAPYFRALTWQAIALDKLGQNDASLRALTRAISMIDAYDRGESVTRSNNVAVDLMACLQIIWQSILDEDLSAQKLKILQEQLVSLEYGKSAFDSGRAYAKEVCRKLDRYKWNPKQRRGHPDFLDYGIPPGSLKDSILNHIQTIRFSACILLMPNGWIDRNKTYFCRETLIPGTEYPTSGFSPYQFLGEAEKFSGHRFDPRPLEAFIRCGIVALATERYKIQTGVYPESLDDLIPGYLPEKIIDPFDPDGELNYKLEKGRPVIYSIGPNLKDDGGKPRAPIADGDLVWRYELPDGFTFEDYIVY